MLATLHPRPTTNRVSVSERQRDTGAQALRLGCKDAAADGFGDFDFDGFVFGVGGVHIDALDKADP